MLRSAFSCFGVSTEIAEHLIILEWTTLVWTPAPGSLFMSPDVGMSNVIITYHCSAWTQSNADLRYYVIRDVIVI